jgi:hypothetical protein
MTVGELARRFGKFWWDFIVGDDWKIAAAVVASLLVGAVLTVSAATGASWLAPVIAGVIAVFFVVALIADVRER